MQVRFSGWFFSLQKLPHDQEEEKRGAKAQSSKLEVLRLQGPIMTVRNLHPRKLTNVR